MGLAVTAAPDGWDVAAPTFRVDLLHGQALALPWQVVALSPGPTPVLQRETIARFIAECWRPRKAARPRDFGRGFTRQPFEVRRLSERDVDA